MTGASHRKYVREELAKADLHQAAFTRDGRLESLRVAVFRETIGADLNKKVFCPFCLVDATLQKFLVSTKQGISSSKAECPYCHCGMLFRNVAREWTVEQYAKWVFDYSSSGFWKKIPSFELWKERLKARGWSQEFWRVYGELKENSPREESFEDRMNRMGEEEAQRWNKEGVGE